MQSAGFKITAQATTGPARGPMPTSSTPATLAEESDWTVGADGLVEDLCMKTDFRIPWA